MVVLGAAFALLLASSFTLKLISLKYWQTTLQTHTSFFLKKKKIVRCVIIRENNVVGVSIGVGVGVGDNI